MSQDNFIAEVSARAAGITGVSTAAGSVMGFLNEYATALGLGIAFGSFLINWYYRHKEYKRGRSKED